MAASAQQPQAIELKTEAVKDIKLSIALDRGALFPVGCGHRSLKLRQVDVGHIGTGFYSLQIGHIFAVGRIEVVVKEANKIPCLMADEEGGEAAW